MLSKFILCLNPMIYVYILILIWTLILILISILFFLKEIMLWFWITHPLTLLTADSPLYFYFLFFLNPTPIFFLPWYLLFHGDILIYTLSRPYGFSASTSFISLQNPNLYLSDIIFLPQFLLFLYVNQIQHVNIYTCIHVYIFFALI